MSKPDGAPTPGGNYTPAVETGDGMLYLAGQTARRGEEMIATGRLGGDIDIETGQLCAAQCANNLLAHAEEHIGNLERIQRVVKITVFVASEPTFHDQSRVADGASAELVDRLRERGRHARSAVGVAALPRNSPVEVDAVVELR